jgi:hypothetical protein
LSDDLEACNDPSFKRVSESRCEVCQHWLGAGIHVIIIDAPGRNADAFNKPVLADAERLQKFR